jgi:hypothetical protein
MDAKTARQWLWHKHRLAIHDNELRRLMRTPYAPPARGPLAAPFRADDLDAWASGARMFAALMRRFSTREDLDQ